MRGSRLQSGGAAALPQTSTRATLSPSRAIAEFLALLDAAVSLPTALDVVAAVKDALTKCLQAGLEAALPPAFFMPRQGAGYARRLLHNDARGRFSVVCMCWGTGQGTPIHEHGGSWCVEGVVKGRVGFTRYAVVSTSDPRRFTLTAKEHAVCDAGYVETETATDYHALFNAHDETSVTLHVYSAELTEAVIMVPTEGRGAADCADFDALAERRTLEYNND